MRSEAERLQMSIMETYFNESSVEFIMSKYVSSATLLQKKHNFMKGLNYKRCPDNGCNKHSLYCGKDLFFDL